MRDEDGLGDLLSTRGRSLRFRGNVEAMLIKRSSLFARIYVPARERLLTIYIHIYISFPFALFGARKGIIIPHLRGTRLLRSQSTYSRGRRRMLRRGEREESEEAVLATS